MGRKNRQRTTSQNKGQQPEDKPQNGAAPPAEGTALQGTAPQGTAPQGTAPQVTAPIGTAPQPQAEAPVPQSKKAEVPQIKDEAIGQPAPELQAQPLEATPQVKTEAQKAQSTAAEIVPEPKLPQADTQQSSKHTPAQKDVPKEVQPQHPPEQVKNNAQQNQKGNQGNNKKGQQKKGGQPQKGQPPKETKPQDQGKDTPKSAEVQESAKPPQEDVNKQAQQPKVAVPQIGPQKLQEIQQPPKQAPKPEVQPPKQVEPKLAKNPEVQGPKAAQKETPAEKSSKVEEELAQGSGGGEGPIPVASADSSIDSIGSDKSTDTVISTEAPSTASINAIPDQSNNEAGPKPEATMSLTEVKKEDKSVVQAASLPEVVQVKQDNPASGDKAEIRNAAVAVEDWHKRELELLKKIEELEKVRNERSEDGLRLELKVREEEIDLLKARIRNLETELTAALSKPGGKNHEMIENIKQQHEELLSKARGMIFDKTKMVKNQELQIEALTTQVQSLKDINLITRDLLEIRNSEVKAMEDRFQVMEEKFKAEKERYGLVLQRAQTSTDINQDLKKEYETQLTIFKELREKYEQRVQALVSENSRLKESLHAHANANANANGSSASDAPSQT